MERNFQTTEDTVRAGRSVRTLPIMMHHVVLHVRKCVPFMARSLACVVRDEGPPPRQRRYTQPSLAADLGSGRTLGGPLPFSGIRQRTKS